MYRDFKAVSLSYRNAPIGVREALSLNEAETERFLLRLRETLCIEEALVISTCNRTEVYYVSEAPKTEEVVALLSAFKGRSDAKAPLRYFVAYDEPERAARQLFRVSLGLESQVVGDLQISNQIKRAYQASADCEMAGPFLHRLLHTVFFTSKKVQQQTAFRDGAASVSYAACELVDELAANIREPRLLVVGLGEIGADVVRNLHHTQIEDVSICNRSPEKAEALAEETGFRVVPFAEVDKAMAEADFVVSGLALDKPFFTKQRVAQAPNLTFKYFLDLSVPRSVEPEAESLPGVVVYNIDHINNRTQSTLEKRREAIPEVEGLIEEAIGEFQSWAKEMVFSPAIQQFKQALEGIRQKQLAKYVKQLDEQEASRLDSITKKIVNDIIKLPVLKLKAACQRGEAEHLSDYLRELFDLEAVERPKVND